ncbi:MAG: hypothetical protein FWC61_03845, partial [Proteobacteria bacterium]|nr:hypothetical protein [Pseudomonadota bacterium]
MKPHSYIITGPTASGKSDFAHALARRIGESRPSGGTAPLSRRGGVIINCDSVQAYRGIENLSASPLANCPPSWGGLSP